MINRLIALYKEHGIYSEDKLAEHQVALPKPRTDNRLVEAGDAFIAIEGATVDGHKFIKDARQRGAQLIIGEKGDCDILVKDSRKATALYAKLYYNDPSAKMKIYGITGTNGKTTTSLMIYQLLRMMGVKAGWIGTMGYYIDGSEYPTQHTTPDILELNEIFAGMMKQGVQEVIMEVSSHALALGRVYGVEFELSLFSNFSQDHLDFHQSMDEYFEAKYLLFERAAVASKLSIINIDDEHGKLIAERLRELKAKVFTAGYADGADFKVSNPSNTLSSSSFEIAVGKEQAAIQSPLIGGFNIDNLALACATIYKRGYDLKELADMCRELKPPKGRLEPVPNQRGIGIYIDYAHTPDALAKLLKSINQLPHKRIISIIGAGGNRDKGKRPLMLKAALAGSSAVIITDDNPRYENPNRIIYEMVRDSEWILPWWIIRERKQAIKAAIRLATKDDIVLICGKGHESYQEIEGIRYDFDDHLAVLDILDEHCLEKADDELILPIDELTIRLAQNEEIEGMGYEKPKTLCYLSTDSRSLKPGSLFVAIKGENFDGNDYVEEVLKDERNSAIGCRELKHKNYIRDDKPEQLMATLMQKYLQMYEIYKVAITGSTGKTSVKELSYIVLSAVAPTIKTLKNENNIIGLCKNILRVLPEHRYGVFELGTNHFGEIKLLADTLIPDAAMILNVGPAHLKYFQDEDGVFSEKIELFRRPLQFGLYPADDMRFSGAYPNQKGVGYHQRADFRLSRIQETTQGLSFYLNDEYWEIPYHAKHFAINSAFVLSLAAMMGIAPKLVQEAIKVPVKLDKRMQVEQVKEMTLIIDCYNANPVSMQAAIEFWKDYQSERPHIAFAGEMRELGESSKLYHQMIGTIYSEIGAKTVYSIGEHAKLYQADETRHFADVNELLERFPLLPKNSVVLVKGSNGVRLDKIIPRLRGEN